ncbi:sensor histidine kinase [Pedobacter sp. GR22-6]|uniref:sensor histidine kinase n=1 Tax=Pedobacter sp. GR22-6 TaxID=3127957 RepID=UPI00307E6540
MSGTCRITVSDSGQGIPGEQQEHIFSIKAEPSFGTNNERGVGLGLVLCKEFTERQGGHIAFNSNPGEGSQFSIFLPLVGIYPKMPSAESGNAVAQA